jgi:hypothetical protein
LHRIRHEIALPHSADYVIHKGRACRGPQLSLGYDGCRSACANGLSYQDSRAVAAAGSGVKIRFAVPVT